MRRNCTWCTDVDLFDVALLFHTDILVFSSDIGKKWMVFFDMGAKLIEALESPLVNNARFIYLNHNGAHYEPRDWNIPFGTILHRKKGVAKMYNLWCQRESCSLDHYSLGQWFWGPCSMSARTPYRSTALHWGSMG